jgi:hypothetical protein
MDKLAEMAGLVIKYQGDAGQAVPDVTKIFTNRFVGGVTLTDAEWSASIQRTADIMNLLKKAA